MHRRRRVGAPNTSAPALRRASPLSSAPEVSGAARCRCCKDDLIALDPTLPSHVVAVHEAAHAVAAERTGTTVTEFWIREHDDGWEGNVSHAGRPGLIDLDAAELDRLGYLAGPEAEFRFAGACDFDECEWDLDTAQSISDQLPEERETHEAARQRVRLLVADEPTWAVILELAEAVLHRAEGESVPHETVSDAVVSALGPDPAPGWRI